MKLSRTQTQLVHQKVAKVPFSTTSGADREVHEEHQGRQNPDVSRGPQLRKRVVWETVLSLVVHDETSSGCVASVTELDVESTRIKHL